MDETDLMSEKGMTVELFYHNYSLLIVFALDHIWHKERKRATDFYELRM